MNTMITLIKKTTIFFLFLALGYIGLAQNVTVSGKVFDAKTNEPLPAATVTAPEAGIGALADDEGNYSLEVKSGSTITVQVSYNTYESIDTTISISGQSGITLDLPMVSKTFTTKETVITASKGLQQDADEITVSIAVVKPKSIDLQATNNISKVITQIPGVDDLDGQINIRGSSGYAFGVGSRVMVMLDGLPLLSGDAGYPELSLIPVDNIAQVEVIKGASSVLYGSSALGGVINVLTADPKGKPRTSLRFRTAFYDKPANPDLDWDGSSSAYEASTHLFHSRKIGNLAFTLQTDLIKESGYRFGTDKEEARGIVMLKYSPEKIQGLSFGANLSARVDSSGGHLYWRSYFPDTTIYTNPNNANILDTVVSGGALYPSRDAGAYRKQLNSRLAVDPFIKYITPGGALIHYRGRYLQNTNRNNTGQSAKNLIVYNDLIYSREVLKNVDNIKFNLTTGMTYTFGLANANRDTSGLYDDAYPGHFFGVYAQGDAKIGSRLNASLGVRLETIKIDTVASEVQPIVRAGLNYKIAEGTNIRSSFGQAFRSPSVAERYTATAGGAVLVTPNPSIKSEKGYSAELGIRQGFKFQGEKARFWGYLDVAGFLMRYNDMVEFGLNGGVQFGVDPITGESNISAPFSSQNIADARIAGVEVTTIMNLQAGDWGWTFSGGYTFLDPVNLNSVPDSLQLDLACFPCLQAVNDVFDPGDKVDQPRGLKYRNKHTVRFSTSVTYKKLSFTTNFRYRSFTEDVDQYLYLVVNGLGHFRTNVRPDGQKIVDFIVSYNVTPQATISLNVDNAFNFEHMIIPGYLGPQRKFTLQIIKRF